MFDTRLYLCPGASYAEVMSKVLNTNQAIIYRGAIFSDEDNKTKAISVNHKFHVHQCQAQIEI